MHDSKNLEKLVAWRAAIAHVPQSIYLADSSIAENIAFGVPRHLISLPSVKQAAEQAQIASLLNQHQKVMKASWVKEAFVLGGSAAKARHC